jgi:hypothetical protein
MASIHPSHFWSRSDRFSGASEEYFPVFSGYLVSDLRIWNNLRHKCRRTVVCSAARWTGHYDDVTGA